MNTLTLVSSGRYKARQKKGRRWSKLLRRRDILDAAQCAICKRSIGRLTMQDIARQLGCANSLLYLYFPNKRELLKAVIDRQRVALGERISAAMAKADGPLDSLKSVLKAGCEFRDSNRAQWQVMQAAPLLNARELEKPGARTPSRRDRLVKQILTTIESAQRQGLVRTDLEASTLIKFMAAITGSEIAASGLSTKDRTELLWNLLTTGIGC